MKLSKLLLALIATTAASASFAQTATSQTVSSVSQKMGQSISSTSQKVGQTVSSTSQKVGQGVSSTSQKVGQSVQQTAPASVMSSSSVSMGSDDLVQDVRGTMIKSGTGLCVHTGYASGNSHCESAPVVVKPVEPVRIAEPVVVVAPPVVAPVVITPPPVIEPIVEPVVEPIKPPVKPVVSIEKVTYAADAFFDTNKAVLKSEAKVQLDDLASKIKGITLEVIVATGHTDSDASDAYNQKLSLRRAESVKAYLVKKGVDAKLITTEGKGEKQPVADNKTKAGKAKNRRVEIEVIGKKTITR